jgi:hypothetical protein
MKTKLNFILLSLFFLLIVRAEYCDNISEMPDDMNKLLPYYQFLPRVHYRNLFYADEYNLRFSSTSQNVFK